MIPARTADTMSEAISISSPNGRVSKRARAAAQERLRVSLFGQDGLQIAGPEQETEKARLLRQAATLRDLAARGMSPRKYMKEAAALEAKAATL